MLKAASARSRTPRSAWLLVLPLFLFSAAILVVPIALMLARSAQDPELSLGFPRTVVALARWDGKGLPPAPAMATFVTELQAARGTQELSFAANRLNAEIPGFRSTLLRTARALPPGPADDPTSLLAGIDGRWRDPAAWAAMRRAGGPLTDAFLLAALDLRRDEAGAIGRVPEDRAVFVGVLLRTLGIAALVAVICLLLGYPLAYVLANLPAKFANPLLMLVLIPFWTSVLVRTTAWVVLLQRDGMVNTMLRGLGLIDAPLTLIYNRTGVVIAMVHVLLPLMVLPLYSVMKGIGPSSMRAAMSLGARPLEAFIRVYLPQSAAGIGAGCLLVFISALGYYVTPELVGGGGDQMISYFIAFYTNRTTNWGMAGALSLILLVATSLLYLAYAGVISRSRSAA
jgi:putative spermidine/putrescine transport system permease protein